MIKLLRRWFRRVVPRLSDPWLDAPIESVPLDEPYDRAYAESLPEFERNDPYAAARYFEARRWRGVLRRAAPREGLVLDLGSGTGSVGLALTAAGMRPVSIDSIWGETSRLAHKRARAPFRFVAGDAENLPFRDGVFEAVICLDTFEHFHDAARAGAEASRVLRSGGAVILATPPRLAWTFRGDPHFNIPLLLAFPPRVQRWIAARRGFDQPHHFVDRIYTTATSIALLFPNCRIERTLTRSRLPKRFFWEALVLRKGPIQSA